MLIQIYGKNMCSNCTKLMENAKTAAGNLNLDATVEKVTDIEKITDAGVLMTPGLSIDGVLKSTGKLLSVEDIEKLIQG